MQGGKLVILLCSIFLGVHFFLSADSDIHKCQFPFSSLLNDVSLINPVTGWAVGEYEFIPQTINEGFSWELLNLQNSVDFSRFILMLPQRLVCRRKWPPVQRPFLTAPSTWISALQVTG